MTTSDDADRIGLLVLDFMGVCTPGIPELMTSEVSQPIPIRDGIRSLVEDAIEQGITVAILSNEISADWELSDDLFSIVDHVVSCSDNRIFKPDRRAFERCLLLTQRSAAQTIVVDDEPDNVTVAASLGIRAFLFDTTDPASSLAAVREMISP